MKICGYDVGHMTKMAAMPIYGKNQGLSLRAIWTKYSPKGPKFRPILVSGRSGSLPKKKKKKIFFFFFFFKFSSFSFRCIFPLFIQRHHSLVSPQSCVDILKQFIK